MKFKKTITAEHIRQIEIMSGLGLTVPQIALMLGISKPTLERMSKKNSAVRDALELGRVKASTELRQNARMMAKTSVPMAIFLLKTQEGFRETDRLEITGNNGGPIEMSREERKTRLARLKKFMDVTDGEDTE